VRRLREVAWLELRSQLQRPAPWVLLLVLGLLTAGLSTGNVTIASGDSSVGGDKAWLNSEYAIAQVLSILTFLFYAFFASIIAGTTVLQDDEARVGELLHATPLRPVEYVWGKYLGALASLLVVLALYAIVVVASFQLVPVENPDEIRGPFRALAYLRPLLLFAVPSVLFFSGTAFAVGERARRPVLIFLLPVALVLATVFFLFDWSPAWLDPRWNRLLMVLDPAGFRWLNETWLRVDRGVEFYNRTPIAYDWVFWLNRAWLVAAALLAVASSVPHCRRVIAGEAEPRGLRRRREAVDAGEVDAGAAAVAALGIPGVERPLRDLGMSSSPPGFVTGALAVARAELRELRHQPGLYLFGPLILLQVIGTSLVALGPFDTRLLLTPGTLAVRTMNTLTLLVCLLLLFYTVESLVRERAAGLAEVLYATPLRSAALLFGKAVANSVVGVVLLLAAFLGCAVALLVQATVPLRLEPFLVVWGLLLVPTFLLWSSFVAAAFACCRDRYVTYALALAALLVTGYYQFRGEMTWAFDWNLWGAVVWSDLDLLPLDRVQLALNRIAAVLGSLFFIGVAVRFFPRRDGDAARVVHSLHPRVLVPATGRLAVWAIAPLVLLAVLGWQVRRGFEGELAEKRQKDYWRKNLATYLDHPMPGLRRVEVEVELEPAQRAFAAKGTYTFHNHLDEAVARLPLTISPLWDELAFTVDGEAREPEHRSGLEVFHYDPPLLPGAETTIGFSHRGRVPDGASKNGGGVPQFVLPAGVVLHTFGPSFLPVPGYLEDIGVDEDNRTETRDFPDDYYRDVVPPIFGSVATAFTTRVAVTAPSEYTVNSVGTLVSDTERDGRRTVVWESDHPVKLLNLVAGRWEVLRRDGTALYYSPRHPYNVDEISEALAASRRWYSEWFRPYPWRELKVSEFPALASYAQGFPTNITFSEGIGFLTRDEPGSNAAFLVAAHEAAHQWWGNLLTPGRGPGGNVLSEGMSHYSTLLLHEQVKGLRARIDFARRIENRYAENRQADSERPLVDIDGSRAGDTTVTYDKGGWVMWMLHQHLGRERALAGLRELFRRFETGPDHPLLEDLVDTLREQAADVAAYDAFVAQWFFDVVVPEYRLSEARVERFAVEPGGAEAGEGGWLARIRVENAGTGRMPVEVAALRGERWADGGDADGQGGADATRPDYRDARAVVALGPGESAELEIRCDFEPERFEVDPDALVLQLGRERALARL
jgi:ABC-type transport system involved in multi-copper enzyme maturation permease subunit